MLASITPLGERGRRRSWKVTAIAYGIGSVAGGATTGALFGGLGAVLRPHVDPAVGWIVIAGLALTALHELDVVSWPLPTIRRQVNEDWLDTYRGWVVGIGFGYQLGLGFVTIVTSAALYLTFVVAALTGSPGAGALVGATFGLARALPLLATRAVTTPEALARLHRKMGDLTAPAHVVVGVGSICLVLVTVGVM